MPPIRTSKDETATTAPWVAPARAIHGATLLLPAMKFVGIFMMPDAPRVWSSFDLDGSYTSRTNLKEVDGSDQDLLAISDDWHAVMQDLHRAFNSL